MGQKNKWELGMPQPKVYLCPTEKNPGDDNMYFKVHYMANAHVIRETDNRDATIKNPLKSTQIRAPSEIMLFGEKAPGDWDHTREAEEMNRNGINKWAQTPTAADPKARPGGRDRGVVFKNASWWVRFYHDGKEVWRKCDGKSQARSLYGKLKAQIREEQYFPKAKKREPLLFKTVAKDYETSLDGNRRRVGDDHARIQFWVNRFGKLDVEAIATSQIEQGLSDLRAPLTERSGRLAKGTKRSLETARRYYVVLHAILEKARKRLKEEKVLMINPASDIQLKKADNTLVRYLIPDQRQALFETLPSRYHSHRADSTQYGHAPRGTATPDLG